MQGERAGRRHSKKVEGSYAKAARAPGRAAAHPQARRAEGHARPPRASCSRPPTAAGGLAARASSSTSSSTRSRRTSASVDMSLRQAQEPHALRRADHRVDDRARGAAGRASARWSRRSSTTGSSRACRSGSTRRSATATNNWPRPIRQSELDARRARTTRACNRGLPPTPIGNPGLASIKAAAKPVQRRSTCTTSASPASPASTRSPRTDAQFAQATSRATRPVARQDDPPRRVRLAGRPLALAADAQRGAGARSGLDDWRYQALPLPPHLFAETVRALPAAGFRGVNVTIPHKEAALALADDGDGDGPRDRRRQHAHVRRATARIHADNTDAPGLPRRAAAGSAYDQTALVLGAGGAARAVRLRAHAGGRRRRPRLEPHARRARRRSPTSSAPRRRRAPGPTSSSTAPRSACATRRRRSRRCPSRPMNWVPEARWWTWSTGTAAHVSSNAARANGADVVDGLEILVAQGAASFERWTGRTAPDKAMREAVADIATMSSTFDTATKPQTGQRRSPRHRGAAVPAACSRTSSSTSASSTAGRWTSPIERANASGSAPERAAGRGRHADRRPARARGRRALRPRPPRPRALPRRPRRRQARHPRRRQALPGRARCPSSATARCWWRWPTRPTCSRSTTSRS